eukprot:30816_1
MCPHNNITSCSYSTRLINLLHQPNNINDKIDVTQVLADYFHILQNHDNDESFEFISNQLSIIKCDINQCTHFTRNYRDRCSNNENKEYYDENIEIVDKIHCYFMHSYDMVYRLTESERNQIQQESDEKSDHNVSDVAMKISCIITNKQKLCTENITSTHNRAKVKGAQISAQLISKYNFGHLFEYKYKGENVKSCYAITIEQKYKSLKQELLYNATFHVTKPDFNIQYKKALLHLNSPYCKRVFTSYDELWVDTSDYDFDMNEFKKMNINWIFRIEYILAIMIYCNYTKLQYEYSKTYRSGYNYQGILYKDQTKHEEFYNLGKNLTIAVHKFGTPMFEQKNVHLNASKLKIFYHGVSCKMKLEEYTNTSSSSSRLIINCPLSTTTSFPVAVNFATTEGMIITFDGGNWTQQIKKSLKYFSCAWLSDFPAENEYLFIQNTRLYIVNITMVSTPIPIEYEMIIKALELLDNALAACVADKIDRLIESIIIAIIHHQLSLTDTSYQPFTSLDEYSRDIITKYFRKCPILWVNCKNMKKSNETLFNELCHSEYKWIKIDKCHELFPNCNEFKIHDIDVDERVFDDILRFLRKQKKEDSYKKIDFVTLKWTRAYGRMRKEELKLKLEIGTMIKKYQPEFHQLNYKLIYDDESLPTIEIKHDY